MDPQNKGLHNSRTPKREKFPFVLSLNRVKNLVAPINALFTIHGFRRSDVSNTPNLTFYNEDRGLL